MLIQINRYQIPVHVHQPSVRARNKDLYTPLMSALAYGNHKCVEELLLAKEIELGTKDAEGNSIYHICARFNSNESLKFLLDKHFNKTADIFYSKNKFEPHIKKSFFQDYFLKIDFLTILTFLGCFILIIFSSFFVQKPRRDGVSRSMSQRSLGQREDHA